MPKRVIDFEAMWASDKLAACAASAQTEYAWLYGLADGNGSFELTNLRVIWGRVAAIRKNLSLERLEQVFDEFREKGLLFVWEENGKRYGHWTKSDVPGRLPPPSWRNRLERLAPPVPSERLADYVAAFPKGTPRRVLPDGGAEPLNPPLEEAQGQDWDLEREREEGCASHTRPGPEHRDVSGPASAPAKVGWQKEPGSPGSPETIIGRNPGLLARLASEALTIWQRERGSLPAVQALTAERRRKLKARLASAADPAAWLESFRQAVRCGAATPFLRGDSGGWRMTLDWLISNDTNLQKVLEGQYGGPPGAGDPAGRIDVRRGGRSAGAPAPAIQIGGRDAPFARRGGHFREDAARREARVGSGPSSAVPVAANPAGGGEPQSEVRVKPEALERLRQREAARKQSARSLQRAAEV